MSWQRVEALRLQRCRYGFDLHAVDLGEKVLAFFLLPWSHPHCLLLNLFLIVRHHRESAHQADHAPCVLDLSGLSLLALQTSTRLSARCTRSLLR